MILKKVFALAMLMSTVCYNVNAQVTDTGDKVGVGTVSPTNKLDVRGNSAIYSDFAGYLGTSINNILPNGKEPTLVIREQVSGNLIPATAGQFTYKGGISFGRGGSGIYSVNENPAGSPYYGDIRFHTTYWANSQYNNADRMIIKLNGNIGIGTTTPGAKLHVDNGNNSYGSILANASEKEFSLYTKTLTTSLDSESFRLGLKHGTNENNGYISFFRGQGAAGGFLGFSTNGTERVRVNKLGNVGIGTATPGAKLEVTGETIINGGVGVGSSGTLHVRQKGDSNADGIAITSSYIVSHRIWKGSNGNLNIGPTSLPSTIVSTVSGNVGIGTTNPDAKLAVNGNIHTREVKVDLLGWPDFIFKKTYQLPTLEEVEKHIKEKGHLKDIPSEKEVLKNGIFLGEMNAKLLQKIEELTLYTIAQEKKINEQEKKLYKKDKEFKSLSERLASIEKLLQKK